jgi:hypothetical protein
MILLNHGEIKDLPFSLVFLFLLMNSNSVTFYRLSIPAHRLPTTQHPTVLSVIQSENDIVLNVLVDQVLHYVTSQNYYVGLKNLFQLRNYHMSKHQGGT